MAKGSRGGRRAGATRKTLFPHATKGGGGGNAPETPKKIISGKKAQEHFISDFKRLYKIDLEKARDRQFDNKNGFNIDKRDLNRNDFNTLDRLSREGGSFKYEVSMQSNGAYRYYISVKEKIY